MRKQGIKNSARLRQRKTIVKLERLIENWEEARHTDTAHFFKKPFRVIWANLVIGISRGVGFVLGVSIIGAVAVAILGWVLGKFVSLPIIGQYIATIVEYVQQYLSNGNP